ncbi:MAG: hypothetical protein Q9220_003839 [cf. Caloplaca sp. 1 TL-2023]
MPTLEKFAKVPPFPSDVPIIDLERLKFPKLLLNDRDESQKLFRACRETGFFLLDLRGCEEGETMLKHAERVFDLNEEIHKLDENELKQYPSHPPADLFRYKPLGATKLEDGSPDRMAFYSLSQDDILGTTTPRAHPPIVEHNRPSLAVFFTHAHLIICLLLSHLDTHLDLRPGTLASLSPQTSPSGTSLRLLKALPSPPSTKSRSDLQGHTDIGSITMLFNIVGGLQVFPPPSSSSSSTEKDLNWRYIRPEPHCALINLGDAMVQWSGGVVRSSMHRVTTAPGLQRGVERFSVAYLVRPAGSTSMRRLRVGEVIPRLDLEKEGEGGEDICATEWERRRAAQIISGVHRPESMPGGLRGR